MSAEVVHILSDDFMAVVVDRAGDVNETMKSPPESCPRGAGVIDCGRIGAGAASKRPRRVRAPAAPPRPLPQN